MSQSLLKPHEVRNRSSRSSSMSSVNSDTPLLPNYSSPKPNEERQQPNAASADRHEIDYEDAFSPALCELPSDLGFSLSPQQLALLHDPRSLKALHAVDGVSGLMKRLCTSPKGILKDSSTYQDRIPEHPNSSSTRDTGSNDLNRQNINASLSSQSSSSSHHGRYPSLANRVAAFGKNELPPRKSPSILQLLIQSFKDRVIILLSICAIISIAVGIYQSLSVRPINPDTGKSETELNWVDGVAILIAICIVTFVTVLNDWQKERQFSALSQKAEDYNVSIISSGECIEISVHDIMVGDILVLNNGDSPNVDGVLLESLGIRVDESAITGESNTVRKVSAEESLKKASEDLQFNPKFDPFITSGSQIVEGNGKMIVTAVGPHSLYGKTIEAMRIGTEITPLQVRLANVANLIAKIGGISALILFIILTIEFVIASKGGRDPASKAQEFLNILIISVTLLVVAVPEGLPLAVALSLAYATRQMLKDNNLVRHLRACETMGNASSICSDKTGTLTVNIMTTVKACFLNNSIVYDHKSPQNFLKNSPEKLKKMLQISIGLNTSAQEVHENEFSDVKYLGSKTEIALLNFAHDNLSMPSLVNFRSNYNVIKVFSFSSERKCMGVIVQNLDLFPGKYILIVKGMPEKLLEASNSHCTTDVDVTKPMTEKDRQKYTEGLKSFMSESLRVIGIAYRLFDDWPPNASDEEDIEILDILENLTFFGFFGLEDPIRSDVPDAVKDCQTAGVFVRMVTGDNAETARNIAKQCGILTDDGVVMEGSEFRSMSSQERKDMIPRLQVLARSSPMDKQILVKDLRDLGEIVAVTGDGTNDGPALKLADIGFSMGRCGTEVAKEASDIILLDDNFSSIVKALLWGRAVNDSIKKFLQFQLTVNITAIAITFVSAISSEDQSSVLSAVQLLWVNLIMDTLAALALATDPPSREMLNRKPETRTQSIISFDMWKMMIAQAVFQLFFTFLLFFGKHSLFNYAVSSKEPKSVIFNTFVWMQIFNEINCRRLDQKLNVFTGISKNWLFISIFILMSVLQTLMIFFGGASFSVQRLSLKGWAISLSIGVLSLPFGALVRLVPNTWIRKILMTNEWKGWAAKVVPEFLKKKPKHDMEIQIYDEEGEHLRDNEKNQFSDPDEAVRLIREALPIVFRFRGGRYRRLLQSISERKDCSLFLPTMDHSSATTLGLMVPFTTLVSEARGRMGQEPLHFDQE